MLILRLAWCYQIDNFLLLSTGQPMYDNTVIILFISINSIPQSEMKSMKIKRKFILFLFELMKWNECGMVNCLLHKEMKHFFNCGVVDYSWWPQFTPLHSHLINSLIKSTHQLIQFFFSLIKRQLKARMMKWDWFIESIEWNSFAAEERQAAHNPLYSWINFTSSIQSNEFHN